MVLDRTINKRKESIHQGGQRFSLNKKRQIMQFYGLQRIQNSLQEVSDILIQDMHHFTL